MVLNVINQNNTTTKPLNQNRMEKEFVPYELALKMKQLGFDEPCFGYWYTEQEEYKKIDIQLATIDFLEGEEDYILAPTWQQAFRWFREKYKIHHRVDIQDLSENLYDYEILEVLDGFNDTYTGSSFKSYEEAQTACLANLIEIVEQKNENRI